MNLGPGNGYIPTSSLREILGALDENLTSDQLDGIIQEIDTDGSGTVDFDGITNQFVKQMNTLISPIKSQHHRRQAGRPTLNNGSFLSRFMLSYSKVMIKVITWILSW